MRLSAANVIAGYFEEYSGKTAYEGSARLQMLRT